MKEIKASNSVNDNINKKIKLIAPLILLTGGMIWINQDTVKADTTPQADTVQNDEYVATSDQDDNGKIGGDDGSAWTIDSKGVLRIQSGTWDDSSVDGFWGDQWLSDGSGACRDVITSVIFEGNIKTGSTLLSFFSGVSNLKSVSLAPNAKVDTSSTKNFSRMFQGDSSLESIDLNIFNWSSVEDAVDMFSNAGLKSVSMENIKAPQLTNASGMFFNNKKLKKANFNGTEFGAEVILSSFLSDCNDLESISLDNAFTNKIEKAVEMFSGDYALENLDVSSMHLDSESADDYGFMFFTSADSSKIKRKSITLPANANISSTKIDTYNTEIYKGWSNGSSDEVIPSLEDYYAENKEIGKTTWTLVEKDKFRYKINYVDENDKPIKTAEKEGYVGFNAEVDPILGYVLPGDFNPDSLEIKDNNDQVFTVQLKKSAPYVAKVTVKYGDGHPDEIFDIEVPFGMSDPASQIDQTMLDKYFNNDSLNMENSFFYINRYMIHGIDQVLPFSELDANGIQGNNLKDIFNNSIKFINDNAGTVVQEKSGSTLNLFEVTFDHYVAPENHNTNNNNNPSTDKKITTIDQKVATFNKTTTLYDNDGKQISDVKLSQNSDWKNDQQMVLNGTTYYRVSTDAWVKASDVYVYTDINSKIRVHQDKRSRIKKATGELTDRALEKSTEWKTDRYTTINGDKYYRVSTNGFVNANEVDEYTD